MTSNINIFRSGNFVCGMQGTCGEKLSECLVSAGVFLDAPCGGKGRCGKCLVQLSPQGKPVLACQTLIENEMNVYLPDESIAEAVIETITVNETPQKAKAGIAADIGTTTVVVHLTDINTGTRIATTNGINSQRIFGADVISRIQYCIENGHEPLEKLIREQLGLLIDTVCSASSINKRDISGMSIAGNTIMQHLAAGLSPAGMGIAPFTPLSLFGDYYSAGEGLPERIYFAPAISAYVGGDITAGMLASGFADEAEPAVYLDIGTNGEIVLKNNGVYYCCAAAAGPAFEGAEITKGTAVKPGAIYQVKWEDDLGFSTVSDLPSCGICGSGLLDALAVLLDTGAVDETGRLLNSSETEHIIKNYINDGKFLLSKENDIYLTAGDIRKLQLAKAAIAAGIQTLLQHTGITASEIKSFILAGGFGSYMNIKSAVRTGLIPESFLPVTRVAGNAAGDGAELLLCSGEAREKIEDIRKNCIYIELSSDPVFNNQFIEQMMFS